MRLKFPHIYNVSWPGDSGPAGFFPGPGPYYIFTYYETGGSPTQHPENAIYPCYTVSVDMDHYTDNGKDLTLSDDMDLYSFQTTSTAKMNITFGLPAMQDGRHITFKDIGGYLNLSTINIRYPDHTIDGSKPITMNTSGAIKKVVYSSALNSYFSI